MSLQAVTLLGILTVIVWIGNSFKTNHCLFARTRRNLLNKSKEAEDTVNRNHGKVSRNSVEQNVDNLRQISKLNEQQQSFVESSTNTETDAVNLIKQVLSEVSLNGVYLHFVRWSKGRCEVIVSRSPLHSCEQNYDDDPVQELDAEELSNIHMKIYSKLELNPALNALLEQNEFLVATPGVSDKLLYDRDFRSFQSFNVVVKLKELFKETMELEGTLIGRNEDYVRISAKGKIINIPRKIVLEVCLPRSQFEESDFEMQKLR